MCASRLFVAILLFAGVGGVFAQAYPVKPIRMIVPVAPGGGGDITARAVGQKLNEALGQQIIIDNRAGAGGLVGMEIAARAAPDGYTIVQTGIGALAVAPSITKKLPYDPVKDFTPVARGVSALNMLVVHPSLPVHTVTDLITHARAHPGKLNFGSSGAGRADHLAGELFNSLVGVKMQHVPYKGGAPAMTDLIAGNLHLIFATVSTAAAHVKSGRVRAVAMTGAKRSELFPNLPTVAEAGVPGFEIDNWYAYVAPRGTPAAIVAKLHAEINRALEMPETKGRLATLGIVPFVLPTPAAFGDYQMSEIRKYADLVKRAGIPVE